MTTNNWYYYRFRIDDSHTSTRWWLDLFIINEIITKVVDEYGSDFWRFHRRSIRDNAGHQISLICYVNKKKSKKIDNYIKNTEAFNLLWNGNILVDYLKTKEEGNIGGTSDKGWCMNLRDSWPFFIQGVSETFSTLLKLVVEDYKLYHTYKFNMLDMEKLYTEVDSKLESIWYYEGGHAFFHHLNAIFGYKNIKTKQTIITSF